MTSWPRTSIGESCAVYSGGTPQKGNASNWHGTIPWVSAKDLKADRIFDAELYISEEACKKSATKIAPLGSLLILVRGMGLANGIPIGEVTSPVAFNQDIRAIVPPASIDSRFLLLALRHSFGASGKAVLSSAAHGTLKIDADKLRGVDFPAPPIREQRRIVTILDEAFEGIATAKAHAEQNLRNALAVFASALDACFVEARPGSVQTTLGAEVNLLAGYAFSSTGYTDATDGVRLLRGDNIMQGYLRWDEAKRWPAVDAEAHHRFALQSGDVVLAMDRPWVKAGLKRAQITNDDLPCLQVQRTARLRPLPTLRSDFLYYLTGSQAFSQYLQAAQTGIGVPHISGKQIEGFTFRRPPVDVQAHIAKKLRTMEERCQKLVLIYQRRLTALDELKQSLLHQAFTGQL